VSENLKVERIIPHHSVVQLSEYFAQNWPLGLAEETVPKLAMMFKEVLGVVATPYSPGQLIGMVKVDRREVAVGRFKDQRDEGQPQLVTLAVVGALPSFPSITSGRTGCRSFRRAPRRSKVSGGQIKHKAGRFSYSSLDRPVCFCVCAVPYFARSSSASSAASITSCNCEIAASSFRATSRFF